MDFFSFLEILRLLIKMRWCVNKAVFYRPRNRVLGFLNNLIGDIWLF